MCDDFVKYVTKKNSKRLGRTTAKNCIKKVVTYCEDYIHLFFVYSDTSQCVFIIFTYTYFTYK